MKKDGTGALIYTNFFFFRKGGFFAASANVYGLCNSVRGYMVNFFFFWCGMSLNKRQFFSFSTL